MLIGYDGSKLGWAHKTGTENYATILLQNLLHSLSFQRCGWGRNRTGDTWIFSPLLYQLSYPAAEARSRMSGARY